MYFWVMLVSFVLHFFSQIVMLQHATTTALAIILAYVHVIQAMILLLIAVLVHPITTIIQHAHVSKSFHSGVQFTYFM
jgi:hypothetical protein